MNTPPLLTASLRASLDNAGADPERRLFGAAASARLHDFRNGTSFVCRVAELADRSVLIATRDQLSTALAMVELDGVAARLIVATPDVSIEHLQTVVAEADVDAIVSDDDRIGEQLDVPIRVSCHTAVTRADGTAPPRCTTEWVLLTSGTSGTPKMVVHSLATLTAPIGGTLGCGAGVVWGTFYDIRRYGGLQILLRALLGSGSLVLAGYGEPIGNYLTRLGTQGATHVSGTPSHWRRALMSPQARAIAPRYIRLSGEIADQGILNALQSFYPDARISHAFASTEAGVAFEVDDGLEGFPAGFVGAPGDVRMRVDDGSLRLQSSRNAIRYLGAHQAPLFDGDGFVDTGDIVERRGDRYHFLGRRSGVINVGGLKVYPEEVEAAINRHPAVRMSMVRPRRNPIVGSLVAAEVVLSTDPDPDFAREILQICHASLAPHKVPATIRFVPSLEIAAAGKVARYA